MKKSFMTRVLATGLSLAMAFSLSVADVTTAEAATSPMESTKITITEGKTSSWVYLKNRGNSKYRIKSFKRTETAKKFITAKVGTKKLAVKVTAKKDAVTNAGLEQKQVAMTINLVKKADANKKNAKIFKTAKLNVVVKAKPVEKPAVATITEAVQKETKKVAVKFSTAVESVKPADVTIKRVDGNVAIPVKGFVLDADKNGAMIETYTEMKDGKEYTVTYTATDEAKTASTANFTATANKVAKLDVSALNIPANDSTEVKIKTIDANDVLLGSYTFAQLGQQKITAEFKFSAGGYQDGNKIFLKKAGDTAEIKVKLHTYEYDENNVEKDTVEGTFVVTAVDETYAGYTFAYSVVSTANEPSWDASSYKQNTVIPVKETYYVYLNIKNASNADRTGKFSISSADTNVALLAGGTAAKNVPMTIKGVKEGFTYLLVKDEAGNLITSLPITVQPARKATTLRLSKNTVSVSNVTQQAIVGLTATIYDQYNQKMSTDAGSIVVKELSVAAANQNVVTAVANTGVAINAQRKTKGTYYYEIKAKSSNVEVSTNLTVGITEPVGSVVTYEIEVSDVDCATDETVTTAPQNRLATIKIAQKRGGTLERYVSVASISAISINGTSNEGNVAVTSDGSLTITATCAAISGAGLYQNAKSGLYKVTATVEKGGTDKAALETTFTVKNDQAAKYATKVKATNMADANKAYTATADSIKSAMGDKDVLAILREGAELNSGYSIEHVTYTQASPTSKDVYVESVDVLFTFGGSTSSNKILVKIPVNATFTMK